MTLPLFALLLLLATDVFAWPDGAPCLRKVLDSMYPQAEEHQGGYREGDPPYRITLDTACYTEGKRITVTLEAMRNFRYKGFAMQGRTTSGKRVGEFLRDDNGSWKYQCFGVKGAITHSHPEPKTQLQTFWSLDEYVGEDVEFVATVVQSLKSYWYQSVRSVRLPHCSFGKAVTKGPDERFQHGPLSTIAGPFPFGLRGDFREFQFFQTDPPQPPHFVPTTQKPTTTTPFCTDLDQDCYLWGNLCGDTSNDYVQVRCKWTCGKCPGSPGRMTTPSSGPVGGVCEDKDPSCSGWSSLCDGRDAYVRDNCRLTCGLCSGDVGPSFGRNDCEDSNNRCWEWTSLCTQDSFVQENCRKTCGTCSGARATTRPKITVFTPLEPTRDSGDCVDKASSRDCSGWRPLCTTDNYVRDNCQRTCNLCKPSTSFRRDEERCEDKDGGCRQWTKDCETNRYVRENCKRTCNLCAGNVIDTVKVDTSCRDKNPDCQFWTADCTSSDYVKENCKQTCGTCSQTLRLLSPSSSQCRDEDNSCAEWRNNCHTDSYVKLNCKSTCGFCSGSSQPRSPASSSAGCQDDDFNCGGWQRFCSQNHIANKCRRTCGRC